MGASPSRRKGASRRVALACGLGLGLESFGVVMAGMTFSRRAAASGPDGLAGTFTLVDPPKQRAKLEAAIDALVDDMNPLMRGIARRRLKETVVASPALRLQFAGGFIEVLEPPQPKKRAPADGTAVKWSNNLGDTVKMRLWVEEGELVERLRGQGNRDNRYVPSDDGGRLTLRSKIFARPFPRPLRFHLSYRRV